MFRLTYKPMFILSGCTKVCCYFMFSCCLFLSHSVFAQARYTVTDIGTLGGNASYANGINAGGQVVGAAQLSNGTYHAFRWDGTLHDLGTGIYPNSEARGINSSGQIVGLTYDDSHHSHSVFWAANGSLTDISYGNPDAYQQASSINDAGQVTGGGGTFYYAYIWQNGILHELGSPLTVANHPSAGRAINDAGIVTVGTSSTSSNPYESYSYLWNRGWQILPSLGGAQYNPQEPWAINNNNQVVGQSAILSGDIHPFFWSQSTGIQDLGTLGGHNGYARSINLSGSIVGYSEVMPLVSDTHAFLYANGQMLDLNSLIPIGSGWILGQAYGINDKGYIVGLGTINGKTHGYLLRPISTPNVPFAVNPRATYLHTKGDPNALNPVPIDLTALAIKPGDRLRLEQLGDFAFTPTGPDNAQAMSGVFSSSNVLDTPDKLHRVTGAIQAGQNFITPLTFKGSEPTDIPEDFFISDTIVTVPSGATHLFVTGLDVFYGDNADPNNNYAVRLTVIRTVSGHVSLEGATNPAQTVQMTFRSKNGNSDMVRNVTLDASGNFSLTDIPRDSYIVHIKGVRWLAKNVSVDAINGDVSGVTATLLAGDTDNNNIVDVDDLTTLLFAFNTVKGDGSGLYEAYPTGDINGDGKIDVDDLTDLLFNFNVTGDP